MGFVFQFYNLVANLTARENVELASQIVADAMDPVKALADVVQNLPPAASYGCLATENPRHTARIYAISINSVCEVRVRLRSFVRVGFGGIGARLADGRRADQQREEERP